jgi:hypothetical protein
MCATEKPTQAQTLARLKAGLLTLKDSSGDWFESLAAALLGAVTAMPFRLAASGSQARQDGRVEGRSGAISFEAKLYRSGLTKAAVTAKIASSRSSSRALLSSNCE